MIQDGGLFHNRLKYLASKERNQKEAELSANDKNSGIASVGVYTEKDAENDLEILKRTVIKNVSNMEDIKNKLNATRKYRLDLMQKLETDIREKFPFFFSHPNLVVIICDLRSTF